MPSERTRKAIEEARRVSERMERENEASGVMATFSAVLPSIATAIRIHGDSGMRIQLDIDDSYVAEVLKLVAWRECELEVTVRPVPK